MKLALGTVQFGATYGISNTSGQTPLREVAAILDSAKEAGITLLDTAPLYGQSEEILGQLLGKNHSFNIVTKSPHFADTTSLDDAAEQLVTTFTQSLRRLKQENIYGFLIHRADNLIAPEGDRFYRELLRLKEKGMVDKIGVSVYNEEQINQIIRRFPIDVIQAPINLFDQRLLRSGSFAKLKTFGIEIHARSVFLQGLLLMPPEKIHPYFTPIRSQLAAYRKTMQQQNAPLQAGALSFVKQIKAVDKIIIGVNNRRQLLNNIAAYYHPLPQHVEFATFACDDLSMILPGQWRLN